MGREGAGSGEDREVGTLFSIEMFLPLRSPECEMCYIPCYETDNNNINNNNNIVTLPPRTPYPTK